MRGVIVSFFFVFLFTQFVKRSVDYNYGVFQLQYANSEPDSKIYTAKQKKTSKFWYIISLLISKNFPVSLARDSREDKSDLYRASSYFRRTVPIRGPSGWFCWNTEDTDGCNMYYIHDITFVILLIGVAVIFIGADQFNQDILNAIPEIRIWAKIFWELFTKLFLSSTKRIKPAKEESRWHSKKPSLPRLHQSFPLRKVDVIVDLTDISQE